MHILMNLFTQGAHSNSSWSNTELLSQIKYKRSLLLTLSRRIRRTLMIFLALFNKKYNVQYIVMLFHLPKIRQLKT
ncbi:hypothetical protein ACS0TY_021639 [Phlomoides rotata]